MGRWADGVAILLVGATLAWQAGCGASAPAPGPRAEVPPAPGDAQPATPHRPALRFVPAGTFVRGGDPHSTFPERFDRTHTVTLTRPLWVMATEVTRAQYAALTGRSPAWPDGCGPSPCGPDVPVDRVSWWDAVAFANALSAQEGRPACYALQGCEGTPGTGCPDGSLCRFGEFQCAEITWDRACTGYRLPTDAEWAHAVRAGTTGVHYGPLDDIAWHADNAGALKPVGQRRPNAWGLYDLLGNATEWCWDWFGPYPDGAVTDPIGTPMADFKEPVRVLRGGSAQNTPKWANAASRSWWNPRGRGEHIGFRLVRTAGASPASAPLTDPPATP